MKKWKRSKCPATFGFRQNGMPVIVYCGQWSCPTCAKKLARKWSRRIYAYIEQEMSDHGTPWYFLTLTLSGYYKTPDQGYTHLKHLWEALLKFLKRHGGHFHYAAFVEGQEHRAGMPHFHVLLDVLIIDTTNKQGKITLRRVHDFAHARGFGVQATYGEVSSRKAAYYVSKYASKGTQAAPKGFRHVRCSRYWPRAPKQAPLLVPSAGEDIAHFIDRVNKKSGVVHEELYKRYSQIWQEFERLQENSNRSDIS